MTASTVTEKGSPDGPQALAQCVHCGFCLEQCPTYVRLGLEMHSPRGRIHLIDALRAGRVSATPSLLESLDLCLQCRACETACPSGVRFGAIMESSRALVVERGAPLSWRARNLTLRWALGSPARLRTVFGALRLYQRSGVQSLVRGTRLAKLLPRSLASAEASLPPLPRSSFSPPARDQARRDVNARRTVALLTGCVMPHLYPRVHEATVRVLRRLGFEIVPPPGQTCCGALSLHAGDAAFARRLARQTIDAFEGADVVIVNAAGCGAAMKEYGDLLAGDPDYAQRAKAFSVRVRDVLEFVAGLPFAERLGEVSAVVTYQDSCHLTHAQGVREAPRRILRAIPGLELREMQASDRCCGSAGLYSIAQPSLALRILDDKMADVAATGADVIATANPGCMMQLELGLRRSGARGEVVHLIELLDRAMQAADL